MPESNSREIEIKLQVPLNRRAAVDAAVAGRTPAPAQRLVAAYADTADGALARARVALRMRREGRAWVQTAKAAGAHALDRAEHEVGVPALPRAARTPASDLAPAAGAPARERMGQGGGAVGDRTPAIDPARHAGTPAGDRLAAALRGAGPLVERYRTDVRRRTRLVRQGAARVELAFDTGTVTAAGASAPICELELEWKGGGEVGALFLLARRWQEKHGLWLDVRSKSERGALLAEGRRQSPPRGAKPVSLDPDMGYEPARRLVLQECTAQIVENASQVASGDFAPEHVHQLRIGLRRLRTAWQLFESGPADPAVVETVKSLFRALGHVRDATVVGGTDGPDAAWRDAWVGIGADPAAVAPAVDSEGVEAGTVALVDHVRSPAVQALLLDLLEAVASPPPADPGESLPVGAMLRKRLRRWHRKAAEDAAGYGALDEEGRHTLRKRIKRLRYALEFAGGLFGGKALKQYLKPLKALQDRLGEINDTHVAIGQVRDRPAPGPADWFAAGWLAARLKERVDAAAPDLKAFAKTKPPR